MSFFRSKKPAAPPTVFPVPAALWFGDLASVQELRDMVNSRAFQKAMATLQALSNPLTSTVTDDPVRMAHRYAWLTGYHDAFRDLVRLTKLPEVEVVAEGDEEWGYINTPQMPSMFDLESE
jgi:hypothetical protein